MGKNLEPPPPLHSEVVKSSKNTASQSWMPQAPKYSKLFTQSPPPQALYIADVRNKDNLWGIRNSMWHETVANYEFWGFLLCWMLWNLPVIYGEPQSLPETRPHNFRRALPPVRQVAGLSVSRDCLGLCLDCSWQVPHDITGEMFQVVVLGSRG